MDVVSAMAGVLDWIGRLASFAARAVREALRPPYELSELGRQVYEVGARSAPLITISGFAVGVVLSLHTRDTLVRFGAQAMIPTTIAFAMLKDIGPLTCGLLVAGRVGAGIGAELGAMKVTEQIDALEATAVDSFKYLAVTRIVACVLAMPLLTVMMDFAGMLGGFVAANIAGHMPVLLYYHRSFQFVDFSDFLPATLKTMVFGFVIGTVGTFLGFTTSGGTEGVGQASTRSVVIASMLIILSDVVLVKIIFFLFPGAR